jgi:hypothetical protein
MRITTRRTHAFVDLKVDEIETTIFGNTHEVNEVIENLQEVIEELEKLKQHLKSE